MILWSGVLLIVLEMENSVQEMHQTQPEFDSSAHSNTVSSPLFFFFGFLVFSYKGGWGGGEGLVSVVVYRK